MEVDQPDLLQIFTVGEVYTFNSDPTRYRLDRFEEGKPVFVLANDGWKARPPKARNVELVVD